LPRQRLNALARVKGKITDGKPTVLQVADVVVTKGCGDACPIFPGKRYEN
jgi:hypothetical protein